MKTSIFFSLCGAILFLSFSAQAANPVILRGQLEAYSFPGLENNANQIWDFVQKNVKGLNTQIAPLIYIADFNFTTEDAEWMKWQKNWIKNNPDIWIDWQRLNPGKTYDEQTNPFPQNFFAFHYDGTNRIQVGFTSVFKRNWVMGPDGVYRDYTGEQYYTLGHELHHIALEAKGIPGRLHHCIFISQRGRQKDSLVSSLANYLVDQKMSSPFILAHGYKWEVQLDPCSKLDATERAQAEAYARDL